MVDGFDGAGFGRVDEGFGEGRGVARGLDDEEGLDPPDLEPDFLPLRDRTPSSAGGSSTGAATAGSAREASSNK